MITSDAELQSNTHPAQPQGGAPVLNGAVEHTERPNVNAMREVIETQDEFEVGKPIEQKAKEVENAVSTETKTTDGKTQIIINIAGKKKAMQFSSAKNAAAFVKDAAAKYGSKFSSSRPDQCPKCGGTDVFYTYADGREYDLTDLNQCNQDTVNCKKCGNKWPFQMTYSIARDASAKEAARGPFGTNMPQTGTAIDAIRAGDRVTIRVPAGMGRDGQEYKEMTGRAVMPSSNGGWVLNMGGKHGTPGIADVENLVKVVPSKRAAFDMFIPGQVISQFRPEMLDAISGQPTDTHTDTNDVDPLSGQLEGALDTGILSMVPTTSPAGGLIGNTVKGDPFRKEDEIRGESFMEEFYNNYDQAPSINVLAKKAAKGDELEQFTLFLKRVVGEIAASFIGLFKAVSYIPMNKVPGVGEVNLGQVEQSPTMNANTVNTGSRVKYLMEKLSDSEIKEAMDKAYCQGSIWHEDPNGGFVYEVFVRVEDIDTETLAMSYTFVTGTKGL